MIYTLRSFVAVFILWIASGQMLSFSQTVIHVNINQPAPLTVDAGTNLVFCITGPPVQLNSTTTGGVAPFTYQWTPSAGLNFNNIPGPKASPVINTVYKVMVTDANGCTYKDSMKVVVQQCTGINDYTNASSLSVFPNPAKGIFNLDLSDFSENETLQLVITDAIGNIVYLKSVVKQKESFLIDLSVQSKGIYFMNLHGEKINFNHQLIIN